ncbi:hypothetical protein ACP70R_034319 [Stipagrostis hirtigluma subsp. patula]
MQSDVAEVSVGLKTLAVMADSVMCVDFVSSPCMFPPVDIVSSRSKRHNRFTKAMIVPSLVDSTSLLIGGDDVHLVSVSEEINIAAVACLPGG